MYISFYDFDSFQTDFSFRFCIFCMSNVFLSMLESYLKYAGIFQTCMHCLTAPNKCSWQINCEIWRVWNLQWVLHQWIILDNSLFFNVTIRKYFAVVRTCYDCVKHNIFNRQITDFNDLYVGLEVFDMYIYNWLT